jgi:hypothetical protein
MKCYRQLGLLATAVALMWCVTGCGGLTASRSISPATFLLPGLVEAAPGGDASVPRAEPLPSPTPAPRQQVAFVR